MEVYWATYKLKPDKAAGDRRLSPADYPRYLEIYCGRVDDEHGRRVWFDNWVVVMKDGSVMTVDGQGPMGIEATTGGPYASVGEAKAVAVASHRLTS